MYKLFQITTAPTATARARMAYILSGTDYNVFQRDAEAAILASGEFTSLKRDSIAAVNYRSWSAYRADGSESRFIIRGAKR